MQALTRLADQLDEAAAVVAASRPDERDPGAAVTTGDAPGLLGEVAVALQRQRTAALHARAREASAAAERLANLAADLRTVAAGYADVDEGARRRTAGSEQR